MSYQISGGRRVTHALLGYWKNDVPDKNIDPIDPIERIEPVQPIPSIENKPEPEKTEPTIDRTQVVKSFRQQILASVDIKNAYPKRAKIKKWQGRVELILKINSQGFVDSVRIDKSSGRKILDKAALKMIEGVSERLKAPGAMGLTEIMVPIEFKL